MHTLIVTTWGDPGGWKGARYFVEVPERRETKLKESERAYKATLGALIYAMETNYALVLISDTLAVNGEVRDEKYESVCEAALKYADHYLHEYIENPEKIELSVLPGVGTFQSGDKKPEPGDKRPKLEAIGSPLLYMLFAFYEVAQRLRKYKPKRLVLDLSHGINYMPVMAYRAVETAVHYYSLTTGEEIELLVYNSDPIRKEEQEAVIHLIEHKAVNFQAALERAYTVTGRVKLEQLAESIARLPPRLKSMGKELGDEIVNRRNKLKNEIEEEYKESILFCRGFVRGARKGLPLFLAYKLVKLSRINVPDSLKLLDELRRDFALVKICNDTLNIFHLYSPNEEVLNFILELALVERLSSEITCQSMTSNYRLDYLEQLIKQYIVDKSACIIASHELDDIKERLEAFKAMIYMLDLNLPEECPYALVYEICELKDGGRRVIEVFRSKNPTKNLENFKSWLGQHTSDLRCAVQEKLRIYEHYKCEESMVDKRNFYAHAGLERHTVRVNIKEATLSYYEYFLKLIEDLASDP
ncbi:MAG: CRISPR-associated CARF protein Csx1 [Thermofilaceae archaeon]